MIAARTRQSEAGFHVPPSSSSTGYFFEGLSPFRNAKNRPNQGGTTGILSRPYGRRRVFLLMDAKSLEAL